MQVRVRVRVMVRMGCGHDGLGRGGWRGVSGGWGGVGGGRVPIMTEASLTEPNDRKRLFVCFFARLCVCVFLLLIGGSRCASLPSAAPSASAPPRRPHPNPPHPPRKEIPAGPPPERPPEAGCRLTRSMVACARTGRRRRAASLHPAEGGCELLPVQPG